MEKITSKEFGYVFCDIWNSSDRRICFVLGAGASKSSGIRTGGELATVWLNEIEKRTKDNPTVFQNFIQSAGIDRASPGIKYPDIYKERFKFDFDSGFDFINKEMENARPGYGYSVLAQILAERQHNIVITTNFDNLTEEALYIYTNKRPLICGHESLAVFAKPSVRRPLIVKIHRDRFFEPQNLREDIDRINNLWIESLDNIFSNSIPVFLGYGGNDGSLMGYLEKIKKFGNFFWCERKGTKTSERVIQLIEKHNGKLVEIDGFDELMFSLQDDLRLPLLNKEIVEIAQSKAKSYQETVENIQKKQSESLDKDDQKAAQRIIEKAGDDWWSWELKAQTAKTNEEKEKVYKEALSTLPQSPDLNGNYAVFLSKTQAEQSKIEKYYLKTLQLDPTNALWNGNYAVFLEKTKIVYDEAEKYYRKALEYDPGNVHGIINYANFLYNIREDYTEAEKYYKKALLLNPKSAYTNSNYAVFLDNIILDHDAAEKHYLLALEYENGNNKDLYLKNYAVFLQNIRRKYDEAEKYFRMALKINPDGYINNESFGFFLASVRKKYTEAEKYYQVALKQEPEDENVLGNYSKLLFILNRDTEAKQQIEKIINKKIHKSLLLELWFYKYAHVAQEREAALKNIKRLICKEGIRSINFNLEDNVEKAIKENHPAPRQLELIANIISVKTHHQPDFVTNGDP